MVLSKTAGKINVYKKYEEYSQKYYGLDLHDYKILKEYWENEEEK